MSEIHRNKFDPKTGKKKFYEEHYKNLLNNIKKDLLMVEDMMLTI